MAMSTISYLAFVCYMAVTSLVPGTLQLAETFGTTKYIAVYLGNTPVALYAVGPFLWSPLSHFVGRRPVLLLANLISVVGTIVVASAPSYGACMVGRVIQGLGGSAFWTLGPASIGDIVRPTSYRPDTFTTLTCTPVLSTRKGQKGRHIHASYRRFSLRRWHHRRRSHQQQEPWLAMVPVDILDIHRHGPRNADRVPPGDDIRP
jgi:hypothetical protein